MEQLNAVKRKAMYDMLEKFMENIYNPRPVTMPFDVRAEDFLMIKYRLLTCIKILQQFGRHEEFDRSLTILPDVEITCIRSLNAYEDISDKFFDAKELMNRFAYHSYQFLCAALKETDWKIFECIHICDYEDLPDRVLEKLRETIEEHWGLMIRSNEEYYGCPVYVTDSEVMEKKGFSPKDYNHQYVDVVPAENLIMTNERIEKMLHICRTEEAYRNSAEYAEIQKYSHWIFSEAHVSYCILNMNDENWCCINYLFGEDEQTTKTILQHTMEFESVIYLLLADMAAQDFLARYEKEKGGAT